MSWNAKLMNMSRTRVRIKCASPYGDYKANEIGKVDGYVRGGDDIPCAVVVIDKRMVVTPVYNLEFVDYD